MVDLIYVLSTLAFFALMLGYVRVCSSLGSAATATMDQDGSRSRQTIMTLDSWIAGLAAIAILVYLVYTLLRPERF